MSSQDKLQQALDLCNRGEFKKAESLLRELIKEDPYSSEAWRTLAQIDLFQNKEVDKAYDELIEALRLDPKNLWALILMGNLLSREKDDYENGSKYYEKVLEYHPDNGIALNNIGATLMEKEKYDEAIRYFDLALHVIPDYANAYYGLACCYSKQNRHKNAFDIALEGVLKSKQCPENPGVRTELLKIMLHESRLIDESYSAEPLFEQIKSDLENEGGKAVILRKDEALSVYAKLEYGLIHGKEEHVIKYNPQRPHISHLLVHELMHLEYAIKNTKAGVGKVVMASDKNKHKLKNKFTTFFKNKYKNLSQKQIDNFTENIFNGLFLQVMNCPLDMFVEDLMYNKYPNMRPYQLQSLFKMEQENIKAATDPQITKSFPTEVCRANKVLNICSSLHFNQLFGINLIHEYHPTKMELDQATDLYEEYKAYVDTFKCGDEYELIEYFANSLKLEEYISIEDETAYISHLHNMSMKNQAEEMSDLAEARTMSDDDIDAANADFALKHQDGADETQTMMMGMYMLGAMKYFDTISTKKVGEIAFEIAKVGITGISPDKKYTLTTIQNKTFGGWELLAYYYVSWARAYPNMLDKLQLPFNKAYELALQMYKK